MIDTVLSNISSVSFITDKQKKIPRSKNGLQCSESLTSTEASLLAHNTKRYAILGMQNKVSTRIRCLAQPTKKQLLGNKINFISAGRSGYVSFHEVSKHSSYE